MEKFYVSQGTIVHPGDIIGAVGRRGAKGCHLHFEARRGKKLYGALDANDTLPPCETALDGRGKPPEGDTIPPSPSPSVTAAKIVNYSPSSKITVNKGTAFAISVTFKNTGNSAGYFLGRAIIENSNGNKVYDSFGQPIYLGIAQQGSNSWSLTLNTAGDYFLQFEVWNETKTQLLDKKPISIQNLLTVVESIPCPLPGNFNLIATPYWDTIGYPTYPNSVGIYLSWNSSSSANYYTIYRSDFGVRCEYCKDLFFQDNPIPGGNAEIKAGQLYYYEVKAINTCGSVSQTASVLAVASAKVGTSGVGLNLRTNPGITSPKIATLPDGTTVKVKGGPVYALISSTSYGWWWNVEVISGTYFGYIGWVWGDCLW